MLQILKRLSHAVLALLAASAFFANPAHATQIPFAFTGIQGPDAFTAHGTFTADLMQNGSYLVTDAAGSFSSPAFGNGNITGLGSFFSDTVDPADPSYWPYPNHLITPDGPLVFEGGPVSQGSGLTLLTDNSSSAVLAFINGPVAGTAVGIDGLQFVNGTLNSASTPMGALGYFRFGAPEIDGGKLPLAALLLGLVAVIWRRRTAGRHLFEATRLQHP